MMSPKNKREEFCRSRFDAYLQQQNVSERIEWQEGPDPPDYYLTVGDQKFAVEVTTIDEKVVIGSNREMPRLKIDFYREKFAAGLERRAKSERILRGRYYLSFAPLITVSRRTNFSKRRKQIEKSLLEFIQHTQSDRSAPPYYIQIDGDIMCGIIKTSNSGGSVRVGIYPITTAWETEWQTKACGYLQRVISTDTDTTF
jgi:hypothetical protein